MAYHFEPHTQKYYLAASIFCVEDFLHACIKRTDSDRTWSINKIVNIYNTFQGMAKHVSIAFH